MAASAKHSPQMVRPLVEVRPANIYDVHYLSKKLRKADREEIFAASGEKAFPHLSRALYRNLLTLVAVRNGFPIGIFGTTSVEETEDGLVAWIWMVGTDELTVNPKELMELSKVWLPFITLKCDAAMNYVDSRNKKHINWLKHLGFEIDVENPVFLHDGKTPFFPFCLELTNV